jgi:leucyl/phenylalanyl-tRNA--protein transferase
MIPWLEGQMPFPDVSQALTEADGAPGLLAAGADLSPQRLLQAYRLGVFPWFSEGQPILWWSTDPRMVLHTDRFAISTSLKKALKKIDKSMRTDGRWQVRFDTAFEQVMRACAAPRRDGAGTWISDDIIAGYSALHRIGHAHSSELWLDGELVGGAYGVSIGRMFYGESMFARISDGSKIALAYLVHFLKQQGVAMIDCQQETAHLASLGAAPITRRDFIAHLRQAIDQPQIEEWKPIALFEAADK